MEDDNNDIPKWVASDHGYLHPHDTHWDSV